MDSLFRDLNNYQTVKSFGQFEGLLGFTNDITRADIEALHPVIWKRLKWLSMTLNYMDNRPVIFYTQYDEIYLVAGVNTHDAKVLNYKALKRIVYTGCLIFNETNLHDSRFELISVMIESSYFSYIRIRAPSWTHTIGDPFKRRPDEFTTDNIRLKPLIKLAEEYLPGDHGFRRLLRGLADLDTNNMLTEKERIEGLSMITKILELCEEQGVPEVVEPIFSRTNLEAGQGVKAQDRITIKESMRPKVPYSYRPKAQRTKR